MTNAVYNTPTIRIEIRDDGIVAVHSKEEIDRAFTIDDTKENIELIKELGGAYLRVIAYISNGKFTHEARKFLTNEPNIPVRIALVAGDAVQNLVCNFFLGLNRPKADVRLFMFEDEAIKWLEVE